MPRKPRPPTPPRVPSFGSFLRGCRLGYGWSERLQAFLRLRWVQWHDEELIAADLAPNDQIPGTPSSQLHICWWDDGETIFDHAPALRAIKRVKAPFTFYMTQTGRCWQPPTVPLR